MGFSKNYSFKQLTSLKIGGPAKKIIFAKNEHQLINAVKFALDKNLDYLVIGSGSNLLVSDKGFGGLVIKNEVTEIEKSNNLIKVSSGIILQGLIDYTIKTGFSGIHKMTGIPGTVGGAIYGNAGAYGQTISDYILEVVAFNGDKMILSKDECGFNYRTSNFKTNRQVILEVTFQFPKESYKKLLLESRQVLKLRLEKYPPEIICPGSFFKNVISQNLPSSIKLKLPDYKDSYGKIPAWLFLNEVGAKGARIGNTQIMPHHSNLIVNLGGGTANDFYKLAKKYAIKVKQKFTVELEPEVQLINLPPLFK